MGAASCPRRSAGSGSTQHRLSACVGSSMASHSLQPKTERCFWGVLLPPEMAWAGMDSRLLAGGGRSGEVFAAPKLLPACLLVAIRAASCSWYATAQALTTPHRATSGLRSTRRVCAAFPSLMAWLMAAVPRATVGAEGAHMSPFSPSPSTFRSSPLAGRASTHSGESTHSSWLPPCPGWPCRPLPGSLPTKAQLHHPLWPARQGETGQRWGLVS